MKKIILSLLILSFTTMSQAQKVKYKKGDILVDKVLSYKFITREKNEDNFMRNYALQDLDGNVIFTIKDTTYYYVQLDHEMAPRLAFHAHILKSPSLKKSTIIPMVNVTNYGSQFVYFMKKTTFFEDGKATEKNYDAFLDKINYSRIKDDLDDYNSVNKNRVKNNEESVDALGELFEREPGKPSVNKYADEILDGRKTVATYSIRERGTYSHVYNVFDRNGDLIAYFNLFQNDMTSNLIIDPTGKRLVREFTLGKTTEEITPKLRINQIFEYAILNGML